MAVTITIEGVDRTSKIDWGSVALERSLTSQVDTLRFKVTRRTGADYSPAQLDDVLVSEGGTTIFGGQIVEIHKTVEENPNIEIVDVVCKDYTFDMDKKLVVATYTNQTVDAIISDINTNYLPAGYTITNVNAPITIGFIAFNYEYPSKCLQQLAQLINYDWYVDYAKNIYFFAKSAISAPFGLTDTNGKYVFKSLQIKNDIKNLRNSIVVRGGTYDGDAVTESFIADGTQTTFVQAYQYTNIAVTVNGAAKTVGIDFIDDPTTKDCLYNYNEKAIKFPSGTKPTAGQTVAVTGNPKIPVIVKVKDPVSIGLYGEFQYKIIDKSISTKQGARDRAKAELTAWADTIDDGGFVTIETGLETGQVINVQSTLRGINENFVISKISSRMRSPTSFKHNVTLMTTQKFGMIEFLQSLLIQKDKEIVINQDEVVDVVEAMNEEITLTESTANSLSHNPISETVTIGESATVQSLNYAVQFVAGDMTPPTGFKRIFILHGSPLA